MPSFFYFLRYAILIYLFMYLFCTSVLRHLAACKTAESVLCCCVLTTCINESSFLSTYSTNFAIVLLLLLLIYLFCTSVLRHLAACNTAESVLCWCVLTSCINESSFLSTYSTNFAVVLLLLSPLTFDIRDPKNLH